MNPRVFVSGSGAGEGWILSVRDRLGFGAGDMGTFGRARLNGASHRFGRASNLLGPPIILISRQAAPDLERPPISPVGETRPPGATRVFTPPEQVCSMHPPIRLSPSRHAGMAEVEPTTDADVAPFDVAPSDADTPHRHAGTEPPRFWRRVQDWLVRYSIRFAPTEAQRTFGVTLLVGAGCGLLAVAFHLTIVAADGLLISRAQRAAQPWWVMATLLSPTLGGLLVGVVLARYFPAARGSGIPQVKAAYELRTERIRLRDGVAKFFLTSLQVGSGASLGREGPTVHMCAALSSALGRWFALSPRSVRRLLPVGCAAGIAAAFNAPIAAVTFTVEEIVGRLDQTVLSGVVVAAALAAVIEHSVLGSHSVFTLAHAVGMESASAVPFYALLGLLAGFASLGFSR